MKRWKIVGLTTLMICFWAFLCFFPNHSYAAETLAAPPYPGWAELTVADVKAFGDNSAVAAVTYTGNARYYFSKDPPEKVRAFYGEMKPEVLPGHGDYCGKSQPRVYSRIYLREPDVLAILKTRSSHPVGAQNIGVELHYLESSHGNEYDYFQRLSAFAGKSFPHTAEAQKAIYAKYDFIIEGRAFYRQSDQPSDDGRGFKSMHDVIYQQFRARLESNYSDQEISQMQSQWMSLQKQGKPKEAAALFKKMTTPKDHWDDIDAYFRELDKYAFQTVLKINVDPHAWLIP